MKKERIEIPFDNLPGRRSYEVLVQVGGRILNTAREAVSAFMDEVIPGAEQYDEKAMVEGKYWAFVTDNNGQKMQVVYDHRTKNIELETKQ